MSHPRSAVDDALSSVGGEAGDRDDIRAMNESRQERAIDALRDWSKLLIGFAFAAATGCVIVLQTEVAVQSMLMLAIAAFVLSVICILLVVRALASLVEQLRCATSRAMQ
jgi:hypothetical protein